MDRVRELRQKVKESGQPVLRDKSFEILLQRVKEKQPERILEIGTNHGLSGIAMLLTCPNAKLTGIEIDEDIVAAAKQNYKDFGVNDRAKIFIGDASQIIPSLTGEYDFIFLDGPKGHYYEYLPELLRILKKDGILFADNVLFRGWVFSKEKVPHRAATIQHSMENFLTAITNDNDLSTELLRIEDGVSITKKLR